MIRAQFGPPSTFLSESRDMNDYFNCSRETIIRSPPTQNKNAPCLETLLTTSRTRHGAHSPTKRANAREITHAHTRLKGIGRRESLQARKSIIYCATLKLAPIAGPYAANSIMRTEEPRKLIAYYPASNRTPNVRVHSVRIETTRTCYAHIEKLSYFDNPTGTASHDPLQSGSTA